MKKRTVLAAAAITTSVTLFAGCKSSKKAPTVSTLSEESKILPKISYTKNEGANLQRTAQALEVAGKKRKYVVFAPQPVRKDPYPLILVLHGDGGDAFGFHQAWAFEKVTGSEAVVAYVEGVHRGWDIETTKDNPDVLYLEAVIKEVSVYHPIDRGRIFAAGYSSGGFMANVLACHRPGLLRAIASNAGGAPYNQLEKWSNGFPKCPGQQPVAMLALHGEKDGAVTPDSGRFSAEYWAYVNSCRTQEMETTGYDECKAYRGCLPGKAVAYCSIGPLGHWVWEESAAASWTFFQRQ